MLQIRCGQERGAANEFCYIFDRHQQRVILNALAQIALRKTMLIAGPIPGTASELLRFVFALALNPWFLGGIGCYLVSLGVWLIVLSKVEVSLAYPLLSIGYVIATAVGYFYLGENVDVSRVAGISLICLGIVVLFRSA